MSLLPLLITLNLILLSRLKLMFRDEGAEKGVIIKMGLITLPVLLIVEFGVAWTLLLGYLIVSQVLLAKIEKSTERIYRNRLWGLVLHLLALTKIFVFVPDAKLNSFISGYHLSQVINRYR
ncbi:MAG: hypothetical protein R6V27_07240 [Balneolaceae bacterium]